MTDAWNGGTIYCSAVTARLVAHICGVQPAFLQPLPLDTPTLIHGAQ